MSDVDLVHLVWKPAGIEPFRRFLETYRRNPTGIEHTFVVLYNGFSEAEDLGAYREVLGETSHRELRVPRAVQDIEAYFWVAGRIDSRYVCFLNSYSEVLAPDWLAQLWRHVGTPGVGAVGATGSWESMYTTYIRGSTTPRSIWFGERLARAIKRQWKARFYRARFDPYPNPHLRTNAFLIERKRWLTLDTTSVASKWDAWGFESGKQSLTRQLLDHGLEVLVVGRDGVAYSDHEWKGSGTFRQDSQRNLLVADNRTRQFAEASHEEQLYLASLAWGAD